MTIELQDGRVLMGTALQIVRQMQAISFGGERVRLVDYIEGLVERARQGGTNLILSQPLDPSLSEDVLAQSLVEAMLDGGLAKLLRS